MILVTGASRGLGAAIRDDLLGRGHTVVGLARQPDPGRDILGCDVTDHAGLKAICRTLKTRHPPLKAVIHAAGVASMNLAVTTPETVTRRLVETNLVGTIFVNQVFAPLMMRAGGGAIVNFSTIAVALAIKGEAIYAASKAGVEAFSRSFAREVAEFGITVNCIAPGPIRTDLLRGVSDEQIRAITDRQVIPRAHTPQDVADLVRLLISPEGRHLSGQVLHVGGV